MLLELEYEILFELDNNYGIEDINESIGGCWAPLYVREWAPYAWGPSQLHLKKTKTKKEVDREKEK